ncbi:hypothetical protein C4901_17060 [Acidiferrobacter sp. SPIII_3]|jgi:hypothetical protein|nr:hypothetical protein C4901_17060 [Acidiferrobacter sp. SPIII_3]
MIAGTPRQRVIDYERRESRAFAGEGGTVPRDSGACARRSTARPGLRFFGALSAPGYRNGPRGRFQGRMLRDGIARLS